jgi:membrane protein DedA with SNARE-associated domain
MLRELPTAEGSRNGLRYALLGLAGLRAVLAVVAIPLAPALYQDHVALLVLLRPSKEVLLYAGYAMREGDVDLPIVVAASLPLLVLAVWVFYFLGRVYAADLQDTELPGIAGRILPRKRIAKLCDAMNDRGLAFVFLGRLASMPSTLIAASAGSAEVEARTFFLADAAGAFTSLAAMLFAGYALGEARETAGPWFTIVGAVVLLALLTLLGKRLSDAGRRRRRPRRAS